MMVLVVLLLMAIFVVCIAGFYQLTEIARNTRDLDYEIKELRLTSRTRVKRAAVMTGPPTDEAELVRVGRASVGRRTVVGGEDGTEQKSILKRALKVGSYGGQEDEDE